MSEPKVAEVDVISDWVAKLVEARAKQREYKAIEDEAKEIIFARLDENEADLGTVDGVPVVQVTSKTMSWPPAMSKLDKVSEEIGVKVSKAVWKILSDLGVKTTLPAGTVAPAIQAMAREVLNDYSLTKDVRSLDTARFAAKKGQQS